MSENHIVAELQRWMSELEQEKVNLNAAIAKQKAIFETELKLLSIKESVYRTAARNEKDHAEVRQKFNVARMNIADEIEKKRKEAEIAVPAENEMNQRIVEIDALILAIREHLNKL